MEKFLSLPIEKQTVIINAALSCFGSQGYKKASIADIAESAGISKSMVFHYFGTKKDLYLYMFRFCGTTLQDAFAKQFNKDEKDFFERIRMASLIEISLIQDYPALLSFLQSVYFETDEEVYADINRMFSEGEGIRNELVLDGMDISRFKEGVDPKLLMKMLVWITEGYMSEMPRKNDFDLTGLLAEFNACMDLLKNNLYKEE